MATADCLIHFEATVNAPGAPTPTLYACKIRRDHFNSLWQMVKAAWHILRLHYSCRRERRRHEIHTKVHVLPNVLHLWNIFRAVDGTNPKRLLPNTSSSSNSVPKFHVLWLSAPSYRHRGFLWRLSLLADFPGPFHGNIHRQSKSIASWKIIPLKSKNKWLIP